MWCGPPRKLDAARRMSTLAAAARAGSSFDYPVMMAGSILTIIQVAIVSASFKRYRTRQWPRPRKGYRRHQQAESE